MKTAELEGPALDWAVAKCEGTLPASYDDWAQTWPHYSSDWEQGGLLIEEQKLGVSYDKDWVYDPTNVDPDDEPDNGDRWLAEHDSGQTCYGPTALVAAMRCYVASVLGAEVEIPEELK